MPPVGFEPAISADERPTGKILKFSLRIILFMLFMNYQIMADKPDEARPYILPGFKPTK